MVRPVPGGYVLSADELKDRQLRKLEARVENWRNAAVFFVGFAFWFGVLGQVQKWDREIELQERARFDAMQTRCVPKAITERAVQSMDGAGVVSCALYENYGYGRAPRIAYYQEAHP